jgi:hypothetical protein
MRREREGRHGILPRFPGFAPPSLSALVPFEDRIGEKAVVIVER